MTNWFMMWQYKILPVRFIIDRAGLVGADGATHGGVFDLAYLSCLPHMMIMCPSDEAELVHMMATAHHYDEGPSALRFPRGEARVCRCQKRQLRYLSAKDGYVKKVLMWPF